MTLQRKSNSKAHPKTKWNLKSAMDWAVDLLKNANINSPQLDAELLLSYTLNCDRKRLILQPDMILDAEQCECFKIFVQRRVKREPIQYILGKKEFWSREFIVVPGVLIPRPETEFLIERLLAIHKEKIGPASILDIGVGSGILAITAALEIPYSRLTAWDVSPVALGIARKNAEYHGVANRIQFEQGDIFDDTFINRSDKFNFILSNPPYIPSEKLMKLMPEVNDFEPRLALDGGPNGMEYYRRIISIARRGLVTGGYLILELGDGQWAEVEKHFSPGFNNLIYQSDYSGTPRVVSARKAIDG